MFTIRDLCWLTFAVSVAFGCYRRGTQNENERLSSEIRRNGYFDDRKWMAVMFPLRDESGKQDGRLMRVWTVPEEKAHPGGAAFYHEVEIRGHPGDIKRAHWLPK